jgi:RNA polymerase sigma-70 factor, ECF subfamily
MELMKPEEIKDLLEQHHASSFGWAMACCRRNQVEAEDLLQLVYLKVLEGKARFEGHSAFKTWLFAVIRRTASDQRRQNFVRAVLTLKAAQQWTASESSEYPDESTYRSEMSTKFHAALALLSRRQREVLELVFYHELNIQEAAEVMGVSLGSARTHYERGKKRLRQLIEESEVYESEWGRRKNPATVP